MGEITKDLHALVERIEEASRQLDIETKQRQISEMERSMQSPEFWQDPETAAATSKRHAHLKKQVDSWQQLRQDAKAALDLARMEDHQLLDELKQQYNDIKSRFEEKELEVKLSGVYDGHDAILHIHSGTGGTDAQDWARMLERMYLRFAERSQLQAEILSRSQGEEAGIKSAIVRLEGSYAYGRLKGEHGVHRLVRKSPFNSDNLRQTSFALVEVTPDIPEPETDDINENDVTIDTYRASGKGGQGVNTTDSAVRITHQPTGIMVAIQNERSQLHNKQTAWKILRARLARLREEQRAETIDELRGSHLTEQWGSQIRNYVLHPYTLVKDTRTGVETAQAEAVLEGELDDFIDAYLTQQIAAPDGEESVDSSQ
jgi:peptide chain release factor 2